jgi:aromatic-L-amino-acid decarboxylase
VTDHRIVQFESDRERIRRFGHEVADLIADYFHPGEKIRILPTVTPDELDAILGQELPIQGTDPHRLLRECAEKIMRYSTNIRQPNYFGLMDAPPATVAVFADAITSALNQNMATWFSSPAATQLEKLVVRWLCELVGYGPQAGGLLLSGASIGNLTALKIARDKKLGHAARIRGIYGSRPLTLYASQASHFSLEKAVELLGIGRDGLRKVPLDSCYRMDCRKLDEQIRNDMDSGCTPFGVVATAGTGDTGAIDPLQEIARICKRHDLWFHVDAPYGGALIFSEKHRALLDGIADADSLTISQHKWVFVPFLCGALLVRRENDLLENYRVQQVFYAGGVNKDSEQGVTNFQDYGLETSRRFIALKLWMTIKHFGVSGLGSVIDSNIELARLLERMVVDNPDFVLSNHPQTSIVCFRYFPSELHKKWETASPSSKRAIEEALDAINVEIQDRAARDGEVWFGLTTLGDRKALLVYVGNFLTQQHHIHNLFEIIKRTAAEAYTERRENIQRI